MENPDFPSDTAIEGKNISRESTFPSEGRTVLEKRKGGQTEKQKKKCCISENEQTMTKRGRKRTKREKLLDRRFACGATAFCAAQGCASARLCAIS